MNLSTECLEAEQVDLLLQGNLTPPEYTTAQEHLGVCEQCRAQVEEKIGPEQWWGDVQSVLLNSRSELFAKGQASSADAEAHVTPTAKLLELLGPTDDPHMLGRIGAYEIIGLLGQGGMGAVFKGFDRSLNRFVAIKMLLPHLAASGAARKRFAREGQAVAAVVDDHVMAIHCVDEWQGVPYLVMTYSRGVSLQKRLCDNGPLEVREILRIGMQAAKGLAAAHAQGIVHRDIKPANIFLDQNVERVQLMDFGLARAVDDASLTRSGTLAGTPQYMSPEQARAETVDHRSDLFSLGSVLYAMCTGHAPFRAESSYSVLRLITDKEPRPIREINPDIPEWLSAIVSKLMAKHTDDRFASAPQVAELLEDCLAHVQQPSTTPLPASIATAARKIVQRPPIGKFIAAAAFAFSLILAGVLIVLELNKGTLTIESEADDIPIRIVHEKEIVERLTVMKSGAITQLRAGEYAIEIDAPNTDLEIENNRVSLSRGENVIVKIVLSSNQGDEPANGTSNNDKRTKDIPSLLQEHGMRLHALHGKWDFMSVESDGVVTQYKTPIELTVEENLWTVSNIMTGGNRFEIDGPNITFHGLTSTGNTSGAGGDTPSIAYGIYELNGDTLTYAMTEFSPASFVGEQTGGLAGPSIQHPQGFDTKGNSNRVYRLRRSSRIPSEADHASSRSSIDFDDNVKEVVRGSIDAANGNEQPTAKQRAWLQSEPYQGPSFDTFFPDDVEGGLALDRLWNASDRETFSDQEILETVRRGLRRTREHRTLILGWIGNKYIWNKSPQNSDAIEIMYHAADFSGERADPYGTRHYAVYFGLSVVQPKTPAMLRTLAELAMRVDDPNDLGRIAWGTSNQRQELLSCLQPFHQAADESVRKKAEICRKIFSGELKAFVWAAEQARVKAELNYADQLPRFREIMLTGSSKERLERLNTVLRERIALIMDDSFIAAFAQCAQDPRPEIRNQVAIIAGARWVWEADQQSPKAIELMLELSSDDDRQVRTNAVYYGLSTVRNKSDAVVKRLLELAFADREPNLFHRIQWGLRDDHERVEKMLLQYQEGANEEHARAAREIFDAMLGRDSTRQDARRDADAEKVSDTLNQSTTAENKNPVEELKAAETDSLGPEQPLLSRTLQQLQGKWRLTRQIAADGDESNAPAIAIWEFQGDRIIVRDGGPGGSMLIQVDDQTTPVQVNLSLETDDESGLGLLSVEGDKLILCLGISQKAPEPESRPEKLQWVSGVWYMELQRVQPGETIVPVKPKGQVQQHAETSPLLLSPTAIPSNNQVTESKLSAVDHRNARRVVEAYVALALAGDVPQATALAKNAAADPKHIAEIPEFLNVQRLKIQTVYVNDPAQPTRALATSEAVRLDADHQQPDGQRDGFMLFTLETTAENWFVIDIDFESESGAEKELKRFLEANPRSMGLPPVAQAE